MLSLLAIHRNLRPEFALLSTNVLLACVKIDMRDLKLLPEDAPKSLLSPGSGPRFSQ